MIKKRDFIKESIKLGLNFSLAEELYDSFGPILKTVRKYPTGKKDSFEKISEKDWDLILEIHEKKLWPLLVQLGDRSLKIYTESENKAEAKKFYDSIQSEILLRDFKDSEDKNHYREVMKLLFQQRFEFLLTIFEVEKKSKWWLGALGIVIGGGLYAFAKRKK